MVFASDRNMLTSNSVVSESNKKVLLRPFRKSSSEQRLDLKRSRFLFRRHTVVDGITEGKFVIRIDKSKSVGCSNQQPSNELCLQNEYYTDRQKGKDTGNYNNSYSWPMI